MPSTSFENKLKNCFFSHPKKAAAGIPITSFFIILCIALVDLRHRTIKRDSTGIDFNEADLDFNGTLYDLNIKYIGLENSYQRINDTHCAETGAEGFNRNVTDYIEHVQSFPFSRPESLSVWGLNIASYSIFNSTLINATYPVTYWENNSWIHNHSYVLNQTVESRYENILKIIAPLPFFFLNCSFYTLGLWLESPILIHAASMIESEGGDFIAGAYYRNYLDLYGSSIIVNYRIDNTIVRTLNLVPVTEMYVPLILNTKLFDDFTEALTKFLSVPPSYYKGVRKKIQVGLPEQREEIAMLKTALEEKTLNRAKKEALFNDARSEYEAWFLLFCPLLVGIPMALGFISCFCLSIKRPAGFQRVVTENSVVEMPAEAGSIFSVDARATNEDEVEDHNTREVGVHLS